MQTNDFRLYANPYDLDKSGFYFSTLEEYETKATASGAEEFEIEFIDGDAFEQGLFADANQANLADLFEAADHGFDEWEEVAFLYLMDQNDFQYAWENYRDLCVQELSGWNEDEARADYAQLWYEDTGSIELDSHLANYIDWERVGRDMELDGGFDLINRGGTFYAVSGF